MIAVARTARLPDPAARTWAAAAVMGVRQGVPRPAGLEAREVTIPAVMVALLALVVILVATGGQLTVFSTRTRARLGWVLIKPVP